MTKKDKMVKLGSCGLWPEVYSTRDQNKQTKICQSILFNNNCVHDLQLDRHTSSGGSLVFLPGPRLAPPPWLRVFLWVWHSPYWDPLLCWVICRGFLFSSNRGNSSASLQGFCGDPMSSPWHALGVGSTCKFGQCSAMDWIRDLYLPL